jgi:hypothetical protein
MSGATPLGRSCCADAHAVAGSEANGDRPPTGQGFTLERQAVSDVSGSRHGNARVITPTSPRPSHFIEGSEQQEEVPVAWRDGIDVRISCQYDVPVARAVQDDDRRVTAGHAPRRVATIARARARRRSDSGAGVSDGRVAAHRRFPDAQVAHPSSGRGLSA